ncbi:MAG TPA: hypothetical protein VHA52_03120 [Candidatus Babeliaceae bacterium]|jgi:natural product precursor|nr:hypothetical protein [Candidatus Babeliaceae bacterium]
MKKLKLKALELGAMEVLTRQQLKSILGGDGSGSGSGNGCPSGEAPCICNFVDEGCQVPTTCAHICGVQG